MEITRGGIFDKQLLKKYRKRKGGGRDLASRTVTPKTDHQESLTHLLEQASTALDQTTNDLITDLKKKLQTLTKQPSSPALHRALTTLLTDIEAALNASHLTDAQKNTLNSLKTRTSDKMNTLTPSSVRDPLETPTQQPPRETCRSRSC